MTEDEESGIERDDKEFNELLMFIRDSRGFDFTRYRRSTLTRRIRKRMLDAGVSSYIDYRDRLEANAEEYNSLFNTILINVTSFFRDAEVWEFVQREVIPELVAAISPAEEIRVWSAGCSSGEEAYTLAMVFAEALGLDEAVERVKIYGTDIDEEALRDARAGLYPARALEPVPVVLREKYFEPNGAQYAVRPELRKRVIFGRHDITRDAGISRLHLLACRNTLMYFNVEAQAQIIERFHFALRDGGFLLLGKAEMLLAAGDRFDTFAIRQRVFRRRHAAGPVPPRMTSPARHDQYPGSGDARRAAPLRDLALEAMPSPVIVVAADGTVALLNAEARSQFALTARDIGRPLSDLEISRRPADLRSLIDRASAERRAIRVGSAEQPAPDGQVRYFDVLVQPLSWDDGTIGGTAVTFVDTTDAARLRSELSQVRAELETTNEELQSTNEELETTNEELQSSIEELETTNEELQSTNEELETTNEELQSTNEELETINEELRMRTGELDEVRAFLEGVMASIAAAVVVLDTDLRVRVWNSGAEDMWGLRASEVIGRSFFGLDFGLPTSMLRAAVSGCMTPDGQPAHVELVAVNRRGRTITCGISCSPLRGTRGGAVLLMRERPAGERGER